MQRACDELGIEIIFANSPQGKGRIERSFDTFQDRLVPELRLHNITDMESANRYFTRRVHTKLLGKKRDGSAY